jgi:hypothetical protein
MGRCRGAWMVVKNEYFTYVGPEDNKRRDRTQVWNVDGISIYFQGSAPGINESTYFAKKHLLTYAGGKHNRSPTAMAKMKKIVGYRQLPTGSPVRRIREQRKLAAKTDKYGTTRAPNLNTFINCDEFEADELKREFSSALQYAQGSHATLELNAASVFNCVGAGDPAPLGNDDQDAEVTIEFIKNGTNYLVKHIARARLLPDQ